MFSELTQDHEQHHEENKSASYEAGIQQILSSP